MQSRPAPAPTKARILPRNWYSISASAGRRMLTLLGLGLVALAAYLAYTQWQSKDLERRALTAIQEASRLIRNLEQRSDISQLKERYGKAWELRDLARTAYDRTRMAEALGHANASLTTLDAIFDTDRDDRQGSIRFMRIEGEVQFRRGERGTWKRARANISLRYGDWVKTSTAGKAELVFADGAVFTLRPETMIHLSESGSAEEEGAADIVFGWVELGTGEREGLVKTPASLARIGRNSEAMVSYDQDRDRGLFASYQGKLEVSSNSGEKRSLGKLQQVTQEGDSLSDLKPLPSAPALVAPEDGVRVDRLESGRLELAWRPVQRASRYALRVSSSRLFAKKIIESSNRSRTRATLGLRGEGSFYWQVAAINSEGLIGPWSDAGSFRVIAKRGGDADDRTPPELEVYSLEPYGNQVIVSGRTEPGARLSIDGESFSIQPDGTFQKAIPVRGREKTVVSVVATDSWGNEATVEKEVFTGSF